MTKFNAKLTLIAVAIGSLSLAGCGGGSSSNTDSSTSSSNTDSSTGVFVDSAVQGVAYQTTTQSGTTNALGEYEYAAGETVTFSIGGVTLPPVAAKSVVTPFDMVGTKDATNPKVINIGLLLQSLDSDKDPSNGITISAATIKDLENLELSGDDFDTDDVSFKSKFAGVNLDDDDDDTNDWKTKEEVEDHLLNANGIVGTWMLSDSDATGLVFLKLLANGQYALLSDQEDTNHDVLQLGTYVLSADGTTITFSKLVGDASTTVVSELAYPIEVSDELNEFEITVSNDGGQFKRVVSLKDQAKSADAINGVWIFDFDGSKLAVFNKDGTYTIFSLEGSTVDGSVIYENGTYQLTAGGAFSFKVADNTDGAKGFSGANPTAYNVDATGTTLTLTISEPSGSVDVTLTKILPFDPDNLPVDPANPPG